MVWLEERRELDVRLASVIAGIQLSDKSIRSNEKLDICHEEYRELVSGHVAKNDLGKKKRIAGEI